jgi:hypothetical protein
MSLIPLWARLALLAALAGACYFAGFVKGDDHGTAKLTDYLGKEAAADQKLMQAREKIVTQIETKYVDRIKTVTVKGDEIIKEVPVYVTAKDDAGCVVPVGFVREYNAAWSGTPAGPPAESDRGPSGNPLSAVATADAGNAQTCLIWKQQRDGLIEFYKEQQRVDSNQPR